MAPSQYSTGFSMNLLITFRQMLRECRGATAIEYGLIAALIGIAIMVSMQGLANETNHMWSRVGSTMQQASAA